MLEGPPGSGKSSLALALVDRGAKLIGDDGVALEGRDDRLLASPPPNIRGLLEIRNVGLVTLPVAETTPVALILNLMKDAERAPNGPELIQLCGCQLPRLEFAPGTIAPATRAEWALRQHGLDFRR